MRIIIAGEMPFLQEIGQICTEAGHDTTLFLVEDFYSAIESGLMMDEAGDADVAVDLHNESAEAKQELMLSLAQAIPEQALVLTSALPTSTTEAASWMANPRRVVGFGLLPPIKAGGVVELTAGLQTSEEALQRAQTFWDGLDFEPVLVADGPGLVRARVVCCLINEAVSALMEGIASAEDIDRAMKLGTNYPYGPLEWADLIGLDTVLGVVDGLFREWGDDRYRPSPLLRRMVAAGRLGKKSGRGFYTYEADEEEG
ncbi:MAG: 3-hydroxyacyl-CoA dehydrogenase family protein [Candidatus Promineifilaceae bacterium]|nr:3-hydroxyacyl-CoA dehydrogenase family protein [Candidatus Promineifilaceae bacterium]